MKHGRLVTLLVLASALSALPACGRSGAGENVARESAAADGVELSVEVRPKTALLGDPVKISLRVRAPEGVNVTLPDADALGSLNVVTQETPDPKPAAQGGREWTKTFTIESYASGTKWVPPLTVKYARGTETTSAPAADERTLSTQGIPIRIETALTTQDSVDQPRDITGVLAPQLPLWQRDGFWWVVGGVAAVLVLTPIVILLVRRMGGRGPAPVAPEIWALHELGVLERGDYTGDERVREYYYALSEIVRLYIERKFSLAAPEMTTEEFLGMLAREHGTLPYDTDRLRAFLEQCDIVKYAAFAPQPQDLTEALQTARAFVHETAAAAARRAAETASAADRQQEGRAA